MKNEKPSKAELVAMLQTKGWDVVTGEPTRLASNRTLEQAARDAHARHKKGETPGVLKQMDNEFQLDLLQLQQLWEHLGLPM